MLTSRHAVDIAAHFGLGTDPMLSGPMARGEQGEVWRLDTSTGSWALKTSFDPHTEAEAHEAATYQEAIARAGVSVPTVVRAVDGSLLHGTADDQVLVYGWVDLLGPDLRLDPVELGRTVASIHRVPFAPIRPPDAWYTEPIGGDVWKRLEVTLSAAGAPFAAAFADLRAELTALDDWVERPTALQMCHRDLWADNVRRMPADGLCVIDWEDCGLADPSHELACVLFEYCAGDPGRARALYHSYLESGGPGRVRRRQDFSMLIAQLGHLAESVCVDWLSPETSELERARTVTRFAEFTDRPLTRALLDELLDAATSG